MSAARSAPCSPGISDAAAWTLVGTVFAAHMVANPHYGFFRDELYFIICGRRTDFGYVDQPPVVPLLAAASQLLGPSLTALRAVSAGFAALCAAAVLALTREMGGGAFAQIIAVLATALAPVLLSLGCQLGPDTVQMGLWPLVILFAARGMRGVRGGWLAAGLALGVATEAKYSAVFLAVALLMGVAVAGPRNVFATRAFWRGAALAAVLILPNAVWQWAHHWPMLEVLRAGQHGKNAVLGPVAFLGQQLLLLNPAAALFWLAGLAWCSWRAEWRWLGVAAVLLLTAMILLHAKAYYPAAMYPALFAAGGTACERYLPWRWLRTTLLANCVATGVAVAPLVLPVLPEPVLARYAAWLGQRGIGPAPTELHAQGALGQVFADMHGWRQLAAQVTALYGALPPKLRAKAAIFTANYGEAAAIDVLAPPGQVPPAISGHNQYFLWGPRNWDGAVLIDVGGSLEQDQRFCSRATLLARFSAPYVMPYEDGSDLVLCEDLRVKVTAIWPRLKHFE